jgi:hypothetical protein
MTQWTKLANFPSALEAEMTAERLRGAGIQAEVRGNDVVGIFGPGFQGATARGVDVLVLDTELDEARAMLADSGEPDA